MSTSELTELTRVPSIDSIPDVDFIKQTFNDLLLIQNDDDNNISDFKIKEMNGDMIPEPMLQEDKSRFVLFPIKQPDVWY